MPTEKSQEETTKYLADALREVFGENQDARRFVDVTRIPLICNSIIGIHEELKELKEIMKDSHNKFVNQDQFFPVRSIVFGIAGILGVASMGAVLKLIFIP